MALDAFRLTAAFVDADGLHTDDELWALIEVFGPLSLEDLARPDVVERSRRVESAVVHHGAR